MFPAMMRRSPQATDYTPQTKALLGIMHLAAVGLVAAIWTRMTWPLSGFPAIAWRPDFLAVIDTTKIELRDGVPYVFRLGDDLLINKITNPTPASSIPLQP